MNSRTAEVIGVAIRAIAWSAQTRRGSLEAKLPHEGSNSSCRIRKPIWPGNCAGPDWDLQDTVNREAAAALFFLHFHYLGTQRFTHRLCFGRAGVVAANDRRCLPSEPGDIHAATDTVGAVDVVVVVHFRVV